MKFSPLEVPLPCEALVDQRKYIGNTPVGYSCTNPAAYSYSRVKGTDVLLCEECKSMLKNQPHRLDLNFRSPAQREAAVNAIMERIREPRT
jgi:hypothetical protein